MSRFLTSTVLSARTVELEDVSSESWGTVRLCEKHRGCYKPGQIETHNVFRMSVLFLLRLYISCLPLVCFLSLLPVQFSCSVLSDSATQWTAALPSLPAPVHHQLQELAQTTVHPVGDAIQSSHPLSSPSPVFHLSQYQSLFH